MMKSKLTTRSCRVFAIAVLSMLLFACSQQAQEIDSAGLGGTVTPGSQQDFFINVGDRVFFGVDSSTLNSISADTLTKQAKWLNQFPQIAVTVEGHADERGTRQYNIALGARRADAVRDFLIGQGVDGNRIKTISYGKERPTATCNDESCWSQNRKVVTTVNSSSS